MKKTPINLSFNGKLIPCPNVSTKPEITSFPQLLRAGCEKAKHNRLFTKKHPTKIKVGDAYALKQGWQDPRGSTHGDTPGLWCQQEPSPWKGPWSCSHLRHRNFINLAAISAKIGEVFGITRHKYKGRRNTGRNTCSKGHWVAGINSGVFSSWTQVLGIPHAISEA